MNLVGFLFTQFKKANFVNRGPIQYVNVDKICMRVNSKRQIKKSISCEERCPFVCVCSETSMLILVFENVKSIVIRSAILELVGRVGLLSV